MEKMPFQPEHDQVLWSVLAEDWRLQRVGQPAAIVH
jgi:hypothetical protein